METKPNIKILVCCHKPCDVPKDDVFLPIQVGKAISDIDLGFKGDDTGDNISKKNKSYCELTAMYWAWKNLKGVDIIGLCHYRRYFDFHNQCKLFVPYDIFPTEQFEKTDLSIPDAIIHNVSKGKIVVARPFYFQYNIAVHYCVIHVSEDLRTLRQVIKETQPVTIVNAYNIVMDQQNALKPYNMFIMKYNDFDRYCNWLFSILSEVENRTNISNYNQNQKRIYGFMAERLFNVWLYAEKNKVIYKPIIKFDNTESITTFYSIARYLICNLLRLIRNLAYMMK